MRVLFLNNFYYLRGGSERVMLEEMRMLKDRGHEVACFSRANAKNEPSEYERYFPGEIDTERFNVSLKALFTLRELIYSRQAREGLRKVIAEFKPDIAHAHNIYGRLSVSVLDELKLRGIPTVLTLHDFKLLCPNYLMLKKGMVCEECKGGRYYRAVVNKCHKGSYMASTVYALESWLNDARKKYDSVRFFISPSRFLRGKVIEFGWPADRIVHIPNFIDLNAFKPDSRQGTELLYIGRLSQEKGVNTLLGALSETRVKDLARLIIVGEGPERANLEKIVSERRLNVIFTGHLNGSALEEALKRAKVVIMPSGWYENAPLSLLESFACGKPVIGARIGGIPEMIDDGVNGYLYEPGNARDLRDKIETFLNLPEHKIAEMGRAAQAKIERQYHAERHYESLMKVYSEALSS